MKQTWLVEIRLKDWRPLHKKGSRIVTYVEVEATFPKVVAVVDFPKKAPKREVPIEIIASVVVVFA